MSVLKVAGSRPAMFVAGGAAGSLGVAALLRSGDDRAAKPSVPAGPKDGAPDLEEGRGANAAPDAAPRRDPFDYEAHRSAVASEVQRTMPGMRPEVADWIAEWSWPGLGLTPPPASEAVAAIRILIASDAVVVDEAFPGVVGYLEQGLDGSHIDVEAIRAYPPIYEALTGALTGGTSLGRQKVATSAARAGASPQDVLARFDRLLDAQPMARMEGTGALAMPGTSIAQRLVMRTYDSGELAGVDDPATAYVALANLLPEVTDANLREQLASSGVSPYMLSMRYRRLEYSHPQLSVEARARQAAQELLRERTPFAGWPGT